MGCAQGAACAPPKIDSNRSEPGESCGSTRRHAHHHAWARGVRATLLRRQLPLELRELVLGFLAMPRWSLAAAVSEADGRPGALRIARGDGARGGDETVERFAPTGGELLAIAHRGGTLAGGGTDRLVYVWERSGRLVDAWARSSRVHARPSTDDAWTRIATLSAHRAAVSAVALLGGDGGDGAAVWGGGVVSGCRDGEICVWCVWRDEFAKVVHGLSARVPPPAPRSGVARLCLAARGALCAAAHYEASGQPALVRVKHHLDHVRQPIFR